MSSIRANACLYPFPHWINISLHKSIGQTVPFSYQSLSSCARLWLCWFALYIQRESSSHKCSMGERSGDIAGPGNTSHYFGCAFRFPLRTNRRVFWPPQIPPHTTTDSSPHQHEASTKTVCVSFPCSPINTNPTKLNGDSSLNKTLFKSIRRHLKWRRDHYSLAIRWRRRRTGPLYGRRTRITLPLLRSRFLIVWLETLKRLAVTVAGWNRWRRWVSVIRQSYLGIVTLGRPDLQASVVFPVWLYRLTRIWTVA